MLFVFTFFLSVVALVAISFYNLHSVNPTYHIPHNLPCHFMYHIIVLALEHFNKILVQISYYLVELLGLLVGAYLRFGELIDIFINYLSTKFLKNNSEIHKLRRKLT
jgi:hypothetical protein